MLLIHFQTSYINSDEFLFQVLKKEKNIIIVKKTKSVKDGPTTPVGLVQDQLYKSLFFFFSYLLVSLLKYLIKE